MLEKVTPNIKSHAFFYSFGYRGSYSVTNKETGDNSNIGVSNADELLYLFNKFSTHNGSPTVNLTKQDESMIDIMVDLWTSFAING